MMQKFFLNVFVAISLLFPVVSWGAVSTITDDVANCSTADDVNENDAMSFCTWYFAASTVDGNDRFWQKTTSAGAESMLFYLSGTGSLSYAFQVNGSTNLIRLSATSTITADTWEHVCVTWTGSTTATNVKFYKNGTETSYGSKTNGVTPTDNSGGTLYLFNRAAADRPWQGYLSEYYFFDRVITAQEIAILSQSKLKGVGLGMRPIRYYPLNEQEDGVASNATYFDYGSTGENCTGSNTPTGKAETVLNYPVGIVQ